MGRRKKDPKPGDTGRYDELAPEQKAKAFGGMFGRSKVRAADKAVRGVPPYNHEETSKKHRWGRKKS